LGESVIDRSTGAKEPRYPIANVLNKTGDIVDKSYDRIPYCGPELKNRVSQLVKCNADCVDRIYDCSSNGLGNIRNRADDVVEEAEPAIETDAAVIDRDL
jgi:hypothetical protein